MERESDLFGPGFLEKASKRLEVENALDKVTTKLVPQPKHLRYDRDKSDLRGYLARGTSAGGEICTRLTHKPQTEVPKWQLLLQTQSNAYKRTLEQKDKQK